MRVAIPKEIIPGERRVALVPELVPKLVSAGGDVYLQAGAGCSASFPDREYADKGAHIVDDVLPLADVILKVRCLTADEIPHVREESILIGLLEPFTNPDIPLLAAQRVTAFAMELIPRTARAQAMDVLSAMSTVAGYKAVLLAADHLQKFFPLLMTAAGTVPPARVLVIGAGVAGLQAIGILEVASSYSFEVIIGGHHAHN